MCKTPQSYSLAAEVRTAEFAAVLLDRLCPNPRLVKYTNNPPTPSHHTPTKRDISFFSTTVMAEDTSKPPSSPIPSSDSNNNSNNNNPATTGYDPNSPWTNYFNILTNRMTPAGKDAFRESAYIRNESRDCHRCDQWRDYLLSCSPLIRFLSQNISDLNGRLDKTNIQCRRCVTRIEKVVDDSGNVTERKVRQGGGFSPDHGILICANEMRSRGHLEDTLAHEMVHAWDHLRWKVDWADLRHAACTEVRGFTISPQKNFYRRTCASATLG